MIGCEWAVEVKAHLELTEAGEAALKALAKPETS
jgi:hypothetical protein